MGHRCECGSTHDTIDLGQQYSLYEKIDLENVECLNETEENSGKHVFKSWENRLDTTKYVESDADNELVFNIPFTGNVKLKGLIIIGGSDEYHPKTVKLFKNRPKMSFDECGIENDQEFELVTDDHGVHEYPIKVVKFSSVHHLTLHFTGKPDAENIRIYYIGLKGEWTQAPRQGVVIATYESRPQIADHSQNLDITKDFSIS